jgi:hypothetical protein
VTNAPLTAAAREDIRRRARATAVRMGLATPEPAPDQDQAPSVLPKRLTDHPGALRAMLTTGRLSGDQATAAIAFLADLQARQRQSTPTPEFPEDAA